eukprot:TRINITY_DN8262_c0_g1_i1.p1 TRINITY_DN8262_c0_g1~~TRINITY_DN8262_c0_g1_i1.p1  ORF type:complete len:211 (+),score=13.58 TRINITY_DN8262_c0_g1_i1:146-778(+)
MIQQHQYIQQEHLKSSQIMGCGVARTSDTTKAVQEPEKADPLPQEKSVQLPKKEPEVKQEPKEKPPVESSPPKKEKVDEPKNNEQQMLERQAELFGMNIDEVKQYQEQMDKMKQTEMRTDGRKKEEVFQVSVHPHRLYLIDKNYEWACNGMVLPDGCASGLTDLLQFDGMKRYTCKTCDFDFCEKCLQKYLIEQRTQFRLVLTSLLLYLN